MQRVKCDLYSWLIFANNACNLLQRVQHPVDDRQRETFHRTVWTLSQILSRKFDKFYDSFKKNRGEKNEKLKSASEKYAAQMPIKKGIQSRFLLHPRVNLACKVVLAHWCAKLFMNFKFHSELFLFCCSSLFLTFILLCCLHELNIFRSSAIKQAASNVNVKIYLLDLYRRGEGETAKTILTRCRRSGSLELFSSLFIFCWFLKSSSNYSKYSMEFSHLLIVIAYSHSCRDSEKRVAMSQPTPRAWPNVFFCVRRRLLRRTSPYAMDTLFCTLRKNCRVVVVMLMCLLESIILLERFIKCLSSIFTKNNNILAVAGVTYFSTPRALGCGMLGHFRISHVVVVSCSADAAAALCALSISINRVNSLQQAIMEKARE